MVQGERETLAGISRDPGGFGPLVMFGLGGIFVEALRDVVFRIAPIDDGQAMEMIRGIRGAAMLDAIRGFPPADRHALAHTVARLSQLAADFPRILEIDINPLMALPHDAVAADARIRISLD
jgi:acetate---CoA ligase (ADP-forming)